MKTDFLKLKALTGSLKGVDRIFILAPKKSIESKSRVSRYLPSDVAERVESFLGLKRAKWKEGQTYHLPAVSQSQADLFFASPKDDYSTFELLEFFRNRIKNVIDTEAQSLAFVMIDERVQGALYADTFGSALAARIFRMPIYGKKAKEQKKYQLKNLKIFSDRDVKKSFNYGWEAGEASNRIRYWGSLPPNELGPDEFVKMARKVCSENKLQFKFYSRGELKKMGAGAFTAVDRGNPDSKGGIIEISYTPKSAKNKRPLALIGKGLCFDTGGYDIKTSQSMIGMKGDMQGAAVALSTLVAAAKLKWPLKIKAYLGVTENLISPIAYKPDEVVISLNGTSIEVVNTDAEGRMVLADTITLATQQKPELAIDFATLTGMAVYSIGKNYAAGFTNQESLHSLIIECGKISGERVWTFPIDKDYGKALESTIADTLQCSKTRGVDHILGAFFLEKFVENKTPWIHIDLSASEKSGGLAHVDTEYTGFGARWALEFLKQHFRLKV